MDAFGRIAAGARRRPPHVVESGGGERDCRRGAPVAGDCHAAKEPGAAERSGGGAVGAAGFFTAMYAWMALTAQKLWAETRYDRPSPTAMHVEVVGEQFQWYFRYPGPDGTYGVARPQLVNAAAGNPLGIDPRDPNGRDDVVSSVLVLPAGREVALRLRSLDVMHGFFIPGMRLKEDAIPGMTLHVHFTPEKVGTYPILCSQVCGLGHDRMQARLMVVSPTDYAAWIAKRERAREAEE